MLEIKYSYMTLISGYAELVQQNYAQLQYFYSQVKQQEIDCVKLNNKYCYLKNLLVTYETQ